MRFCLAFLPLVFGVTSAHADAVDATFADAVGLFERALPSLPSEVQGVDVSTYRDALSLRHFRSAYWGGTVSVGVTQAGESGGGSCKAFAAFVRLPPQDGQLTLTLCPQFFTPGADALRRLTVLHELVHVVAGPNECRAMAFAATVEKAATGSFTPVERYWRANNCPAGAFRLPE